MEVAIDGNPLFEGCRYAPRDEPGVVDPPLSSIEPSSPAVRIGGPVLGDINSGLSNSPGGFVAETR